MRYSAGTRFPVVMSLTMALFSYFKILKYRIKLEKRTQKQEFEKKILL